MSLLLATLMALHVGCSIAPDMHSAHDETGATSDTRGVKVPATPADDCQDRTSQAVEIEEPIPRLELNCCELAVLRGVVDDFDRPPEPDPDRIYGHGSCDWLCSERDLCSAVEKIRRITECPSTPPDSSATEPGRDPSR
ncbi:MAG: hypothetical protein KJ956_14050 [Actinobacteria bacterium]|nr:hypothetical protein [Actinomycetota bacterium]